MTGQEARPVAIRLAAPDDYGRVGDLVVEAFSALRQLRGFYEAEIRDVARRAEGAEVLVAVDGDGTLVGTVTLVTGEGSFPREVARGDEVEFRMLAVSPAVQGQGVGRALAMACVDRAQSLGRPRIAISSGAWMTAAHALYAGMGFVRDPSRDWSPAPGIDLVGFTLDVPGRNEPAA
ncbi:MAG TPA: GNAT family N-acetyltransferase [Mycobacteriales bacterium]|nr:GNAT family N-acetyltransferase [Mycobacteriales bacterium]